MMTPRLLLVSVLVAIALANPTDEIVPEDSIDLIEGPRSNLISSDALLAVQGDREPWGAAFSGGGWRALGASIGFAKALWEANVTQKLDTISSVSGGSWFTTQYTFSKKFFDAVNDGEPEDMYKAWLSDYYAMLSRDPPSNQKDPESDQYNPWFDPGRVDEVVSVANNFTGILEGLMGDIPDLPDMGKLLSSAARSRFNWEKFIKDMIDGYSTDLSTTAAIPANRQANFDADLLVCAAIIGTGSIMSHDVTYNSPLSKDSKLCSEYEEGSNWDEVLACKNANAELKDLERALKARMFDLGWDMAKDKVKDKFAPKDPASIGVSDEIEIDSAKDKANSVSDDLEQLTDPDELEQLTAKFPSLRRRRNKDRVWTRAFDSAKDKANSVKDKAISIKDMAKSLNDKLKDKAISIKDDFAQGLKKLGKKSLNLAATIKDGAVVGFKDAMDNLGNFLKELVVNLFAPSDLMDIFDFLLDLAMIAARQSLYQNTEYGSITEVLVDDKVAPDLIPIAWMVPSSGPDSAATWFSPNHPVDSITVTEHTLDEKVKKRFPGTQSSVVEGSKSPIGLVKIPDVGKISAMSSAAAAALGSEGLIRTFVIEKFGDKLGGLAADLSTQIFRKANLQGMGVCSGENEGTSEYLKCMSPSVRVADGGYADDSSIATNIAKMQRVYEQSTVLKVIALDSNNCASEDCSEGSEALAKAQIYNWMSLFHGDQSKGTLKNMDNTIFAEPLSSTDVTGERLDSASLVTVSQGRYTTIENKVYGILAGQKVDMLVVHINEFHAASTVLVDENVDSETSTMYTDLAQSTYEALKSSNTVQKFFAGSLAPGYTRLPGQGCKKKNELLSEKSGYTLDQCQAVCDADPSCVSFERKASEPGRCQVSSSCGEGEMTPTDGWYLYVKDAPAGYTRLPGQGCKKRNELLSEKSGYTLDQCQAVCDAGPSCVSFERKASEAGRCQVSSSCGVGESTPTDGWYLYVKAN